MITVLIIYAIGMLVTWLWAGYNSGKDFSRVMRIAAPGQWLSIQYSNVFFQGLCWPSYWFAEIGKMAERKGQIK